MISSRTVVVVFALAVLGMWFAQPLMSDALALDTSCEFHESSGYIVYSVTDGASQEYTAQSTVEGDIQLAGTPPSLTGPADIDSVEVTCLNANGSGNVHLEICALPVCYGIYDLSFKTHSDCTFFEVAFIPSMSGWGLILLFVALVATGAYVIRRRRVVA
ncbi:MAG: hypothetical protein KKG33_14535 [candidate division Zixibacteria bacterium]|nr:hypothetical protein [candidate division Zixibacteria bacterium]MBU1470216.1 hypothetical protein [candidate division Zixibacteria bacterium]MBU2626769.1 hypothetical protein [candidate division Zixibacteria bacterium]